MTLVVHGHHGQGAGFLRSEQQTHRPIDPDVIALDQSVGRGASAVQP